MQASYRRPKQYPQNPKHCSFICDTENVCTPNIYLAIIFCQVCNINLRTSVYWLRRALSISLHVTTVELNECLYCLIPGVLLKYVSTLSFWIESDGSCRHFHEESAFIVGLLKCKSLNMSGQGFWRKMRYIPHSRLFSEVLRFPGLLSELTRIITLSVSSLACYQSVRIIARNPVGCP